MAITELKTFSFSSTFVQRSHKGTYFEIWVILLNGTVKVTVMINTEERKGMIREEGIAVKEEKRRSTTQILVKLQVFI
jgi:hypothetical protein